MSTIKYVPFCLFFGYEEPQYGDHGLIVQGLRRKLELSQIDLARDLEISVKQLKRIESGLERLDILCALRIDRLYKIPYKYLMNKELKIHIGLPNG